MRESKAAEDDLFGQGFSRDLPESIRPAFRVCERDAAAKAAAKSIIMTDLAVFSTFARLRAKYFANDDGQTQEFAVRIARDIETHGVERVAGVLSDAVAFSPRLEQPWRYYTKMV